MDFDLTTETITPTANTILTAGGAGALQLPSGITGSQPAGVSAGGMRWNTTVPRLEFYNGSAWVAITGGSQVSTFSGGTTGLTPNTATSGAITLAGTLVVGNGGTGLSSTPTNGQLLIGNGTNYTLSTLTAGNGILVANTSGAITISNANTLTGLVTVGATATNQSNATDLPYTYNIISATSGGNALILPVISYVGQQCNIENRTGSGLSYYPQVGSQIENIGVNNPYTNATNGNVSFVATSTTQWYGTITSYSIGTGISATPNSTVTNQYTLSNSGVTSNVGTTNQIAVSSATGASTISIVNNPIIPGTADIIIPSGTTAQRPSTPANAMIRYNTTDDVLEGYATIGTNYTGISTYAVTDTIAIQRSNINRKRITLYDDFISGVLTSTNFFGSLGWTIAGSSAGSNTIQSGITDHPGILRLATAATASATMGIYLGNSSNQGTIIPQQVEYASYIVRIPGWNTTNYLSVNIGFSDSGNTSNNAIYFQAFYGLANWVYTMFNSGTQTYLISGTAVTAGTWYFLEMWQSGTNWAFAGNGQLLGVLPQSSGPTVAFQPFATVTAQNGTSCTLDIDAFSIITTELGNRY
jgi:hypothetical protein